MGEMNGTVYKVRKALGGVYKITNTITGQYLISNAVDLKGMINLFQFSRTTGSCVHMKLQGDWEKHGGHVFSLEVLEEIEKIPRQLEDEFEKVLENREALWREKMYVQNKNEY